MLSGIHFLSRRSIENSLSTSSEVVVWTAYTLDEVVVWTAYTLPSPDPTWWEYTGDVVVVVVVAKWHSFSGLVGDIERRMQISKTASKGKKKQHANIFIPKEVVVEILQRVHCQDLYETLKKVCMQWCSIIYSGSFAYSHVERGILKSSSSFSQLEAVIINRTDDKCCVIVSALEWRSFPNYALQEHEQYWETKYIYTANDVFIHRIRYMVRVNSVNGFVCFWSDDARLNVCNPITKEHIKTAPYFYNTNMALHQLVAVGFGFCQLSYEYKVVVLHEYAEYGEIKPFVLTVVTDHSWRSLKAIPDTKFISRHETGAHVKGVLYWYLESCTPNDWPHCSKTIKRLVCFDLTTEEVDMIMVPAEIDGVQEGQYAISIAEKGGNLCLINISHGPFCSLLIQVYVAHSTTDLSSLNSWEKEFTVTVPNMAYNMNLKRLFVLIVTDDMLVIRFSDGETYGFINVATGVLLSVLRLDWSEIVIPYVPSLVTLFHRPPILNSSFGC